MKGECVCGGGGLARRKRRGSRQSALINEKSIFNENKTRQDVSVSLNCNSYRHQDKVFRYDSVTAMVVQDEHSTEVDECLERASAKICT